MKVFLIVFSVLFSLPAFACTCSNFKGKKSADRLKEEMEIIIYGTAIETVDSKYDDYGLNHNVRIKIEKVINGPDDLLEIITYQRYAGNCAGSFKIGERYLIMGHKFEFNTRDENSIVDDETLMQQSKACLQNENNATYLMYCLAKTNTIMETSSCIIFNPESKFASYF